MSLRVGVDIIQIDRVKRLKDRWGSRLLRKVLGDAERLELESCGKLWRLASHWAVKEATAKVLGQGILDLGLRNIELRHRENGAPYVVLTGKARDVAKEKCIAHLEVSISHDGDYVVAVVVAEEKS